MKKIATILFFLLVGVVSANAQVTNDAANLYSIQDIRVSNVYPNPAADQITLDYEILNSTDKVVVSIHNVLGSLMGEYTLTSFDNKIQISLLDYKAGMYFYTLSVNDKKVATKKFLVKKS